MEKEIPGNPKHRSLQVAPAMKRDALGFLQTCDKQYGDIVWYSYSRKSNAYLISNPISIKYVFEDNYINYSNDVAPFKFLKLVVGDGLLTGSGEEWVNQRQFIEPAFHRQNINSLSEVILTEILALLEKWYDKYESVINIENEMRHLTSRVVAQVLFGTEIKNDIQKIDKAFSYVNKYISAISINPIYRAFMGLPTIRNYNFRQNLRMLDNIIGRLINQHRKLQKESGCFLSTLTLSKDKNISEDKGAKEGLNDDQLKNALMTLFLAGYETTANALTWTWFLLSQNLKVRKKLDEELSYVLKHRIATVDDLPNLKYSRMIIQESLPLFPPIWAINRRVVGDDSLDGYHIPA